MDPWLTAAIIGAGLLVVAETSSALPPSQDTIAAWLETSLKRVFPQSRPTKRATLSLESPRGATCSFQACFRNTSIRGMTVTCAVDAPDPVKVTVRRVGFVPMGSHTAQVPLAEQDGVGHIPGLVPDPLFPERQIVAGPNATHAFWLTVHVPPDTPPGVHTLKVRVKPPEPHAERSFSVRLRVSPVLLPRREGFPVVHWWNADGLYDWYKVEPLGDAWFRLAERYLRNMVEHGCDVVFVPLIHHRREVVPRPAQLVGVARDDTGRYRFDWSKVKRFVELARSCGFREFEWPHFWHMYIRADGFIRSAAEPARIYLHGDHGLETVVPADYPALGPLYTDFLRQFLGEFRRFLDQERLLPVSYFHVSDEPGGAEEDIANFKAAAQALAELAPWTKGRVIDALSDVRYGKMRFLDIPIPNVEAARAFRDAGIPHWVYYCCGPRGAYLNRFFDTPLTKVRMSGWLFHRLGARGFLHWGYNFWYVMDLGLNPTPQVLVDPFTDGAVGTSAGGEGEPYGDSFVVYPGVDGPIDSIRWEVFAESLQDLALLQAAGVSPDDPLLSPIKDYAAFPKSAAWIAKARGEALRRAEARQRVEPRHRNANLGGSI